MERLWEIKEKKGMTKREFVEMPQVKAMVERLEELDRQTLGANKDLLDHEG